MSVTAAEFRSGMRQLAAAVNVITTVNDGTRAGMTATAIMSLTAEPPQLGIAVNRTNASFAAIGASKVFAVNVLRHDQARLASRFAGADGVRGEERFSEGDWSTLATGAPTLSDGAATFDCRVVQTLDLSSHVLFVGEVQAVRTNPTTTPLLFMDGAWASLVRATDHDFAAYEGIIAEIDEAIDAANATGERPSERLRLFTRSFSEISARSIEVLREFFGRETVAPADRIDAINNRKRSIEAKLRGILRDGAASGAFALADAALTADAIIGMMNSIHRWPDGRNYQATSVGEQFGSLVAAMVAPRPASDDAPADRSQARPTP